MKLFKAIAAAAVISTSFITANPAEAKVINVPCADGGGSGGWMHQSGLPDRYYPLVLLGVSEMKPGQYSEHPMYHGLDDGGRTRYGYCSYSTSAD